LTSIQRAFLKAFVGLPDQQQFCLVGGTALAEYYLGHRLSLDLDLFTAQEPLILPVSYQIERFGPSHPFQVEVVRRFTTFVEFLISQGDEQLKVDLALDSPFRFEPPQRATGRIMVSSLLDLQVDKLLAYYGRAEPRDAVDLYFILQQASLDELLALAARKDPGFDLYWFAVALNRSASFPDDLARWPVKMLQPLEPTDLKQQFQQLALGLLSRVASE
jgi:hypothetical protein